MIAARIGGSVLAGIGLALVPGVGAGEGARADDKGPVISAQFENDMFFGDSDRHYTHGSRFAYLTGEDDVPDWVLNLGRLMPFYEEQPHMRVSYALGQSIFTPDDVTRAAPDPTDRPYAGWLYGAAGLVTYGEDGARQDSLELALGVVGPWSLAEDVQTTWHRWFDFRDPKGWDSQIENEPGFVFSWDTQDRVFHREVADGLAVDLTPNWGLSVGTVMTHANAGVTLRLGDGLTGDFGPPRIRPSLPGSGFFTTGDGLTWYVFAGLGARAVARNIFLDGNTFEASASVDKEILVGDAQAGFSIGYRDLRIGYTQIFRTREFEGQDDPDVFGAISLSFRF